jgi:hypothetical protein
MPLKLYTRGRQSLALPRHGCRQRLRGSCETTNKAIAARQIAEIEAREWKCRFDGPQAVLTFAQAAALYRKAGKSTRNLAPVEDYFKDTLVKDIKGGTIRQMAIELFPHYSGRAATAWRSCRRRPSSTMPPNWNCAPDPREAIRRGDQRENPGHDGMDSGVHGRAPPNLGAYALFMFLTGCRPSEGHQRAVG